MNKQEQRIIEAARQVLSDWLGCDLTANVSEDFYELESALKDYGTQSAMDFDWQSSRNQAAKDILCAMISNEGVADERNVDDFTKDNQVKDAVLYADKLIAKLKEK